MVDLQRKILNGFEEKPMMWWRCNSFFDGGGKGAGGGQEQESLEKILNKLNSFHLTRAFTAEYSNEKELMRDLPVKPVNTQVLDPRSFHPCHCKKAILFSQAIRLNRILAKKI